MEIRFTVQPDRERLAAAVRYYGRRQFAVIRTLGVLFLLIAAAIAVFVVPLGVTELIPPAVVIAIGGLLYVAVLPVRAVRRATAMAWLYFGHPTEYVADRTGLRYANEVCASWFAWRLFKGVAQLPGQLLFVLNDRRIIPVPVAGLSVEDVARLRTAVPYIGRPPASEVA